MLETEPFDGRLRAVPAMRESSDSDLLGQREWTPAAGPRRWLFEALTPARKLLSMETKAMLLSKALDPCATINLANETKNLQRCEEFRSLHGEQASALTGRFTCRRCGPRE